MGKDFKTLAAHSHFNQMWVAPLIWIFHKASMEYFHHSVLVVGVTILRRLLNIWVYNTNRVCLCLVHLLTWLYSRTAIIFGTLKDGSLTMNSLALNNCFSNRNICQNGINALSKNIFLKPVFFFFFFFFFVKQLKIFHVVWTIMILFKFTSMWFKHFLRNVWRDEIDFQCQH